MRRITVLAVLGLAVALVSTAVAGPAHLVRLKGWVVDEPGGRDHANAESAELIAAAHEEGVPLVFVASDDTLYPIKNPDTVVEYAGKEITVIGTVNDERELKIGSVMSEGDRVAPPAEN